MDELGIAPKPRRQRPKDSFQNELQAKLYQRKNLGLATDITDSEDDFQGSPYDYQSARAARPGSAKHRPDKSPDFGRGLGITTMRTRDLSQLLGRSSGHSDDENDNDEVMAANLGRSTIGGSWQAPGLKTPSPKQDIKLQRKTPTRESPKDSLQLKSMYGRHTPSRESPSEQIKRDSIYGRKTPTKDGSPKALTKEELIYGRQSPKDQGRLDLQYERKTPTKDSSPRALTKEEIIFGRKTPVSDGSKSTLDGRRLPGMDPEKPWQPPNFRTVSPSSPSEQSRGSRGVTPIDPALEPITESRKEKVTPRLQRGERVRGVESPRLVSFNEAPKPQARSRSGDRKSPARTSLSPSENQSSMKRTTPTVDLFGKSRTSAAEEVEQFVQHNKKDRYGVKDFRKPVDGRETTESSKYFGQDKDDAKRIPRGAEYRAVGQTLGSGKKTPPGYKSSLDRKSPLDKDLEDEKRKKSQSPKPSSLMDFLSEGSSEKPKAKARTKFKTENDEIDSMLGTDHNFSSAKPQRNGYKSPDPFTKKMSMSEQRKSSEQTRRSPQIFETSEAMPKTIPKAKKEDESSLCEEIPLDPTLQAAKAEEKAWKSGKRTTERARADNAINAIADAQCMKYIEPAKKIRPVTVEAKVQHRPKPRYGILPGAATKTLTETQFSNTSDIRDAIYEEWYAERQKEAKKKKKEEEKKKLEEEEKKKKEEIERLKDAELSYKAWFEQKKGTVFRDQAKNRNQEALKKNKEYQDQQEKQDEAVKIFKHWKDNKDAMIKQELRKKRESEEKGKREKEDEAYYKYKDRASAYEGWKRKKEKELKHVQVNSKKEKENEKKKTEEMKRLEREKQEEALDRYNGWIERKESQGETEKQRSKQHLLLEEDSFRPAWSPAGRTIPFGR